MAAPISIAKIEVRSFILDISIAPLKVHYCTTQRRSRHNTDTVSEFHAEASQATASEGLTQGPYVAARAGYEPTTLRSIAIDSTNEPPRPTKLDSYDEFLFTCNMCCLD